MCKVVTVMVPGSAAMGDWASHCCNNRKSLIGMQDSALGTHSKTLEWSFSHLGKDLEQP